MLSNYVKIAIRGLVRHKGYSLISIFGLAIGMTCSVLILLWVQDELSYDDFFEKNDRIFRIVSFNHMADDDFIFSTTPPPLGEVLKDNFREIIDYTRYGSFFGKVLLKYKDLSFYEGKGRYVDPSFFDIFDVAFIQGNRRTALEDTFSIVITESMASKFFGGTNPMGKSLHLENVAEMTVTGVVKDSPANTSLQYDFLVPFKLYAQWGSKLNSWVKSLGSTFILLSDNADYRQVNDKISLFKHPDEPENSIELALQPLKRIYLNSKFIDYDPHVFTSDIKNIWIFGSTALLILLIACINFINLTTARSIHRCREIGLRKVVGASRNQLVRQFIWESILLSVLAIFLALALAEILLPVFNKFTEKTVAIDYSNIHFIFGLIGIVLFTGFVSGSYPAAFLSGYQPASALRGIAEKGPSGGFLRKVLVVIQFAFSIGLIIATLVISKQLNFIHHKNLGIDRNNVIYIQNRPGLFQNYCSFKKELEQNPKIFGVTTSSLLADTYILPSDSINWENKTLDENITIESIAVDDGYFKTFNLTFEEGEGFDIENPNRWDNTVVINEEAKKVLKIDNPIGFKISVYNEDYSIIGVVNNYHIHTLKYRIPPLFIFPFESPSLYIFVKLDPDNMKKTISFIESKWKEFAPEFPFEFNFMQAEIQRRYNEENRLRRISFYFTILAIFLSCLGLFGLAAFMAIQRSKEIGVRKVMGALEMNIFKMFIREFLKLVGIAFVIGSIVTYIGMKIWLKGFVYHTELQIYEFAIAGLIAVSVALITISFHAFKAAKSSPVNLLRYE